jgi:hypothetical protein
MRNDRSRKRVKLDLRRSLDGGTCVNQRSLLDALDLFGGDTPTKPGAPLTLDHLLEALWVLELAVVSRSLAVDGTLPQRDLDRTLSGAERVFRGADFPQDFLHPIIPASDVDQRSFAATAATFAVADLHDMSSASGWLAGLDQPLPSEDAARFFETLQSLAAAGAPSDDQLHALMAGDAFRGSKCVAGLALLGPDALRSALDAPQKLDAPVELVGSTLINRFRYTYVRNLAYSARDAYVPARRWRPLSERHSITFAEVLRRDLAERHTSMLAEEIDQELTRQFGEASQGVSVALPPIGLYVLMTASERGGPIGVLRHARETFADHAALFRQSWKLTRSVKPPETGWTMLGLDPALDAVASRIDEELTNSLGRIKRRNTGFSVMSRVMTSGVAVSAAVAGAVAAQVLAAPPGVLAVAAAAGSALLSEGVKELYGIRADGVKAQSDDFRGFHDSMRDLHAEGLRLDNLERKVSRVLGRKLVRAQG